MLKIYICRTALVATQQFSIAITSIAMAIRRIIAIVFVCIIGLDYRKRSDILQCVCEADRAQT